MPTFLTEYVGNDGQEHAGPCIFAANREEADHICGFLFADPYGDAQLRVLGALEDLLPDAMNPQEQLRRKEWIRSEMARIIKETPR